MKALCVACRAIPHPECPFTFCPAVERRRKAREAVERATDAQLLEHLAAGGYGAAQELHHA